MAERSAIEWTQATWNPVVGCTQVSPGCTHCYAMEEAARQVRCAKGLGRETHYEGTVKQVNGRALWTGKVAAAPQHILERPLHWAKPKRIFVNSMSDLFHEDLPDTVRDRIFAIMALCPQHTFQILTKRAKEMHDYFYAPGCFARILLARCGLPNFSHALPRDWPLPNVWLGITAENQKAADERIPLLLETPAALRWVSIEPMLGQIYLTEWLHDSTCDIIEHGVAGTCTCSEPREVHLDWVVGGFESGPNARPGDFANAYSLRDQCSQSNIPFLWKQNGEFAPVSEDAGARPHFKFGDGTIVRRVGKKAAGRLLDGKLHDAYPEVRSWPQ